MSATEQRESLKDLAKAEAQLASLRLRVLGEAERSGATDQQAAASAADWVAVETRQTRISARADLRLSKTLDQHRTLCAATAAGRINVAQARVIVTEEHLVGLAADHDAKRLALLGRHLFEVVAPDLADRLDGQALAAEEAAALRRTFLQLREDDEGTCHGRFRIPTLHGQILNKLILALSSPTLSSATRSTHAETDAEDDLPTTTRQEQAFCRLLEAIPAKGLPKAGGTSATVVVKMTLEQLLGGLAGSGASTLDTGDHPGRAGREVADPRRRAQAPAPGDVSRAPPPAHPRPPLRRHPPA